MTTAASKKKSDKMELSDSDEDIDLTSAKTNSSNSQKPSKPEPAKSKSKKSNSKTYDVANKMWVEKYRPAKLNEIVSHSSIISTIGQLVSARKLPHLLFYGPPGTGKTTTILAAARQLNGERWRSMTLELNASDDRGIGVVRDQIKVFASTKQMFAAGFKLIILDEADAMTSSAQFSLRRVIEKFTKNTRFCLICNYVNKIIPALQSRCTKFRFAPLRTEDIRGRVQEIADAESVKLSACGMKSILRLSGGDMRRCLNILQSAHTSYDEVNESTVHECTGCPKDKDIERMLHAMLNKDFKAARDDVQAIMRENGLALNDVIKGCYQLTIRMKLDALVLCEVLSELADLEHRLTVGTDEQVQMAALVAIYQVVRHRAFEEHRKKQ